ncbi:MAG: PEGA domain-containing protein [Terriglobia bacterium]
MLAAVTVAVPMTAQTGKPLASKEVMDLLQESVKSSDIADVVQENGISFRMSDELETQFRRAGATDELIDALKKASKPEEKRPPAPVMGTLKVQSQPGGAQVYVNDELKGMTNSAGDLRLSGLSPGSHLVRVSLGGYKVWENSVAVTAGETVTAFVTLEKQNVAPTVTLDADRTSIQAGQPVTLRWTSLGATAVDIEPGVGKVGLSGTTSVSPRESTSYTLTAIGLGGTKTASVSIGVTAPAPPTLRPPVQPVVGNLPGFPVPGASLKAIRFFESGFTPPPIGQRTYQAQFDHRTSRYISWELDLTCPAPGSRFNFTIYATWYSPTGQVFANQTVPAHVDSTWDKPVFNSGRGFQRVGMWKRGEYRVELTVNGNRVGSGLFNVD